MIFVPRTARIKSESGITGIEQKEVIYEQLEKINSKYEIGEPSSKEDQAFVKKF